MKCEQIFQVKNFNNLGGKQKVFFAITPGCSTKSSFVLGFLRLDSSLYQRAPDACLAHMKETDRWD